MFKDLQEDIDSAKELTEEEVAELNSSTYESGRKLTEGDLPIFGLFVKNANGDHLSQDELHENLDVVEDYGIDLHIGLFHPDEIGELYEATTDEILGEENYFIFKKEDDG